MHTSKVNVVYAPPAPPLPQFLPRLGERVKMVSDFYLGVPAGAPGTVFCINGLDSCGDRLVGVRFDGYPLGVKMFSTRLESLDHPPVAPAASKVEEVILTLSLAEAQLVHALVGTCRGRLGHDIYLDLSTVREIAAGGDARCAKVRTLRTADPKVGINTDEVGCSG